MSAPAMAMVPDCPVWSPMTLRSSVVFPAPLRPQRVTPSPRSRCRSTSRRTRASPYQADNPSRRSIGAPQVGGDDAVVLAYLVVRPLDEDLAGLQPGHPVGEPPDDTHVVLDHDHGPAVPDGGDELDRALHVLQPHPGGRLVEQ